MAPGRSGHNAADEKTRSAAFCVAGARRRGRPARRSSRPPRTPSSSAPATSPTAMRSARPPRPRTCSSTSRARSSRSATTPTRAARPGSTPTATARPGAASRRARSRSSATTSTAPRTPAATSATSAACRGRPDEGLLQLRPRQVAPRRHQQQLRAGRRLPRGLAPGAVAAAGPRGASRPPARSPCGTTRAIPRASTATTGPCATSGRRSTTPTPRWCSRATTTTTSASLRRTPTARRIPARGIRQFVAGTGGRDLYKWEHNDSNSEVKNNETFGVLKLTLHDGSYDWEFVPVEGQTFTDRGSAKCH